MANIDETLQKAYQSLEYNKESPFTEQGFVKIKEEVSNYVLEIVNESYRIAKRNKSDLISQVHVETASENLIKKKNREYKNILVSIGSFLLGMSITKTFETISNSESFTIQNTILVLVTGIVGALIIGLNIFDSK